MEQDMSPSDLDEAEDIEFEDLDITSTHVTLGYRFQNRFILDSWSWVTLNINLTPYKH